MIEKIRGIRIQGKCFTSEVKFTFFTKAEERISLLYGKNGSGKSTISEGVLAASNEDYSTNLSSAFIDLNGHDLTLPTIKESVYVFNENYIDKNVKIDDDGLGTIILLGGQADIQSKIDECQKKLDCAQEEYSKVDSFYQQYLDVSNPLSPQYHWSMIQNILKKPGGWAERDSKLKGNRRNSSVTNDIILDICTISSVSSYEDLRKEFESKKALYDKLEDDATVYPDEIKQYAFPDNWENSTCVLLAKVIEKPKLSGREQQILSIIQDEGQITIENSRLVFSKDSTSFCPFCFQSVDSEYKKHLVESINRVLNKETDEHIEELSKITFLSFDENFNAYNSLDTDLVKKINDQIIVCQKLFKEYADAVALKKNNVYAPQSIKENGLCDEMKKLNLLIWRLERKRLDFNAAIKQKRKLLNDLIEINKKIAHLDVVQEYKNYKKQEKESALVRTKLESRFKVFSEKREELKLLNQRKQNVGLAINSINNALDYVFFKKGRLSIELRDNKYYLKSNGNDVRPKDVSLGERNIIALCYFFTQIVSNQDVGNLYQQEEFIVIDDPVSSFDFENKVGIISFLRYQIKRIVDGNANSKVLLLTHDIATVFDLMKAFDEICKSRKGIANLSKLEYSPWELQKTELVRFQVRRSEYATLLLSVYNFANNGNGESVTIGNEMRRVLEAFSTFTYRKSIENVSCDSTVLSSLGDKSIYFENLMYRLVLHNESHYEEQVYNMHDDINFYEFISDSEKQRTAKDVLCFMYLLNKNHLKAYLKDIEGAMDVIKIWSDSIPLNQSFNNEPHQAIIHLRTIRLYDLSLSAGLGNNIMESDIPYEEYKTENQVCDFALKISGDSMTPEIADGSIVLVKVCDRLESEDIGAFYYNGDVYCKRLINRDNKTYLVSSNTKYEDILVKDDDTIHLYGKVVSIA